MPIRSTKRWSVWSGWMLAPALALGCNAVLDNPPGQLATPDASVPVEDSSTVDSTLPEDSTPASAPEDASLPDAPARVVDAAPPFVFDAAGPTCPFGDKICNGSCVSTVNPAYGCGPTTCSACSLSHATTGCAAGGCSVTACDPGYADCDQIATNGCETDLSQSSHCGTCNASCSGALPFCAPAASGFVCSSGCGAQAPTPCGSQCVSLMTSLDNCGACSHVCPAVANGQTSCSGGVCGFTCHAGFHNCGGACASDVSLATCGASCAPCPTEPNAITTCNGAQCVIACQPGFADCDGLAANGCEANLANDSTNCGQCKVSCSGRACSNGTCAPPPPPPPPDAGVDAGQPPPPDAGVDSGQSPPDAGTDTGGSVDAGGAG